MLQSLSQNEDTIVALATPNGVGAISVIRVSGPNSISSVDKVFLGKKKLADCTSHTIHYGKIIDAYGETIDDVLVSIFLNGQSFTGEDSIEISTHGSPFVAQKVISILLNEDVRLAEPGEFTKRAFLNGKIDLAQAEAVADVINSRTEVSLRGARNQLDGILSSKIDYLREKLIQTSSLIELELDFAEEDIQFMSMPEIVKNLEEISDELDQLLSTFSFGKVIRDGVNVALVGPPNAGKSSLLNYFLKEARAIVSEVPGTTRDIIREDLFIDGILFRLSDTAGIRATDDHIEKEGVFRSRNALKEADIVLFLNDTTIEFSENLYQEILELNHKERVVSVGNKVDLEKPHNENYDVLISAKTGEGIEKLFAKLKEVALGSSSYTEKTAIVTNIRHFEALKKANESIESAMNSIKEGLTGEFISVDLRNAVSSLGEIIGIITADDILNNIFSKFCIGK
ncbi:MAG: tRNA modification gtpase trme [Ignavibacteria bacterium]|nr:MAG: tRNA modification gtpase trme [Ignavibacteria bacterium]KAF0158555.1 MAG: tRNA modification gtpase trme [Ignavibacteria bacterium]